MYAEPPESFGELTRAVYRAFTRALEIRIAPHGVSAGQWPFLRELWREDGLTQAELSRRVNMRQPTTLAAMRSLERSGLAQRRIRPGRRRETFVLLTAKGRALGPVLIPLAAEVNEIALAGFSGAEVDLLRRALPGLSLHLEGSSPLSARPARGRRPLPP